MKNNHRPIIVIAPDKFKGTLSSVEAAKTIKSALESILDADLRIVPMADGGEGTAKILAGPYAIYAYCQVAGFSGRRRNVVCHIGLDDTAYFDVADVIGMKLLTPASRPVMERSSYYVGPIISSLLRCHRQVVMCVGGTATVDGGAGVMGFFEARFKGADKRLIYKDMTPTLLQSVAKIDWSRVETQRFVERLRILVDVDVPLVPGGSSAFSSLSFARQKGVEQQDIWRLGETLAFYAGSMPWHSPNPDNTVRYAISGAGGGVAAAFGAMGCRIDRGAPMLSRRVWNESPDLVITGEGCFDLTSMRGKVVGTLISEGLLNETPVMAICGKVDCRTDLPPEVALLATTDVDAEVPDKTTAQTRLREAVASAIPQIKTMLKQKNG